MKMNIALKVCKAIIKVVGKKPAIRLAVSRADVDHIYEIK